MGEGDGSCGAAVGFDNEEFGCGLLLLTFCDIIDVVFVAVVGFGVGAAFIGAVNVAKDEGSGGPVADDGSAGFEDWRGFGEEDDETFSAIIILLVIFLERM